MNLRQAQRSLAELMSKCEEAHIQLPKDPWEARAEAVEAIIHSLKNQKVNLKDAQEELQQKFGLELAWKQHLEDEEAKRQRRRQKKTASRGAKAVPTLADASKSLGFLPEAPLLDDNSEVNLLESDDDADEDQARGSQVTKRGVMTPAKRAAFYQGHGRTTRKMKPSRELILSPSEENSPPKMAYMPQVKMANKMKSARASMMTASFLEEKAPAKLASAAFGHDQDVENNGESDASGSPNQHFEDLLEVEDFEDVGGSSDEEFTLD